MNHTNLFPKAVLFKRALRMDTIDSCRKQDVFVIMQCPSVKKQQQENSYV